MITMVEKRLNTILKTECTLNFAENGKNFVFYFKKFHLTDNSCEIVFTLNQYGLLK